MAYLRLTPYCRLIEGAHNVCLLDCDSGTPNLVHHLESDFLREALGSRTVEEVLATRSAEERGKLELFLRRLVADGLAALHDAPYHSQPVRRGTGPGAIVFFEPTRLNTLFLEVTQDCGLDCRFCRPPGIFGRGTGCGRYGDIEGQPLTPDRRRDILHQATDLGAVNLHLIGGDALLALHLREVLDEAFSFGISSVTIWTTGLEPIPESLMADARVGFALQVYSHRPESHDEVAGRAGAHRALMSCLERLKGAGKKVFLSLVVTRVADDHWKEAEAFFRPYSSMPVRVAPLYPTGDPDRDLSLPFPGQELLSAKRWFARPNINLVAATEAGHTCFRGKLAITLDGRVLPCPVGRAWTIGDAHSEDLWAILSAGRHRPYWRLSKAGIGKCARCEFRLICFDCRVIQGRGKSLTEVAFCDYDPDSGTWAQATSSTAGS